MSQSLPSTARVYIQIYLYTQSLHNNIYHFKVNNVCPILMFITACDIYIESENNCRLHILFYYELKFNRNNLFKFKHIFSIKNLKHKWFLLVITHVHSLNKYIFVSMFIVCVFDICNHAIIALFYFSDYKFVICKQ